MEDTVGTIKGFSNVRRLNNRLFSLDLQCKEVQWYLISASPANTVAIQFHRIWDGFSSEFHVFLS